MVLAAAVAVYLATGAGAVIFAGAGVVKWIALGAGIIVFCAGVGVWWGALSGGKGSLEYRAVKAGVRAVYVYIAMVCVLVVQKADMLIPARRVLTVVAGMIMVQAVAWSVAVLVPEKRAKQSDGGSSRVGGGGGV